MFFRNNKALPLIFAFGLPASAIAQVVLHDQGPTRPIAEYVEPLPQRTLTPKEPPLSVKIPAPRYPVTSSGLSPGPVTAAKVQLPQLAGIPFFLVGNDSLSRDWLVRFGARLRQMSAVGFLVQAESDADLQAVRQLIPEIPITPLDASPIGKALGIVHYPVLISSGVIEQ